MRHSALALFALIAVAPAERVRVVMPAAGMKVTIVSPDSIDPRRPVELILYALPNGNTVVSDSGGTWRATERMVRWLSDEGTVVTRDTVRGFDRWQNAQVEILRHPNSQNRILHTEMIGEMNAYLHAMLSGRPGYDDQWSVLGTPRAYSK